MRSVHVVQRRPLFIPFRLRCLLALAWLAHNTFLGSPIPKIVPPFIPCRRRAMVLAHWLGSTGYADGNLKGLLCMRVDLPKIVPPFILRR